MLIDKFNQYINFLSDAGRDIIREQKETAARGVQVGSDEFNWIGRANGPCVAAYLSLQEQLRRLQDERRRAGQATRNSQGQESDTSSTRDLDDQIRSIRDDLDELVGLDREGRARFARSWDRKCKGDKQSYKTTSLQMKALETPTCTHQVAYLQGDFRRFTAELGFGTDGSLRSDLAYYAYEWQGGAERTEWLLPSPRASKKEPYRPYITEREMTALRANPEQYAALTSVVVENARRIAENFGIDLSVDDDTPSQLSREGDVGHIRRDPELFPKIMSRLIHSLKVFGQDGVVSGLMPVLTSLVEQQEGYENALNNFWKPLSEGRPVISQTAQKHASMKTPRVVTGFGGGGPATSRTAPSVTFEAPASRTGRRVRQFASTLDVQPSPAAHKSRPRRDESYSPSDDGSIPTPSSALRKGESDSLSDNLLTPITRHSIFSNSDCDPNDTNSLITIFKLRREELVFAIKALDYAQYWAYSVVKISDSMFNGNSMFVIKHQSDAIINEKDPAFADQLGQMTPRHYFSYQCAMEAGQTRLAEWLFNKTSDEFENFISAKFDGLTLYRGASLMPPGEQYRPVQAQSRDTGLRPLWRVAGKDTDEHPLIKYLQGESRRPLGQSGFHASAGYMDSDRRMGPLQWRGDDTYTKYWFPIYESQYPAAIDSLDYGTAKRIQNDFALRSVIVDNFQIELSRLGLQIEMRADGVNVSRTIDFDARDSHNTPNSWLSPSSRLRDRFSRMITSLATIGCQEYAAALVECLQEISNDIPEAALASRITRDWMPALTTRVPTRRRQAQSTITRSNISAKQALAYAKQLGVKVSVIYQLEQRAIAEGMKEATDLIDLAIQTLNNAKKTNPDVTGHSLFILEQGLPDSLDAPLRRAIPHLKRANTDASAHPARPLYSGFVPQIQITGSKTSDSPKESSPEESHEPSGDSPSFYEAKLEDSPPPVTATRRQVKPRRPPPSSQRKVGAIDVTNLRPAAPVSTVYSMTTVDVGWKKTAEEGAPSPTNMAAIQKRRVTNFRARHRDEQSAAGSTIIRLVNEMGSSLATDATKVELMHLENLKKPSVVQRRETVSEAGMEDMEEGRKVQRSALDKLAEGMSEVFQETEQQETLTFGDVKSAITSIPSSIGWWLSTFRAPRISTLRSHENEMLAAEEGRAGKREKGPETGDETYDATPQKLGSTDLEKVKVGPLSGDSDVAGDDDDKLVPRKRAKIDVESPGDKDAMIDIDSGEHTLTSTFLPPPPVVFSGAVPFPATFEPQSTLLSPVPIDSGEYTPPPTFLPPLPALSSALVPFPTTDEPLSILSPPALLSGGSKSQPRRVRNPESLASSEEGDTYRQFLLGFQEIQTFLVREPIPDLKGFAETIRDHQESDENLKVEMSYLHETFIRQNLAFDLDLDSLVNAVQAVMRRKEDADWARFGWNEQQALDNFTAGMGVNWTHTVEKIGYSTFPYALSSILPNLIAILPSLIGRALGQDISKSLGFSGASLGVQIVSALALQPFAAAYTRLVGALYRDFIRAGGIPNMNPTLTGSDEFSDLRRTLTDTQRDARAAAVAMRTNHPTLAAQAEHSGKLPHLNPSTGKTENQVESLAEESDDETPRVRRRAERALEEKMEEGIAGLTQSLAEMGRIKGEKFSAFSNDTKTQNRVVKATLAYEEARMAKTDAEIELRCGIEALELSPENLQGRIRDLNKELVEARDESADDYSADQVATLEEELKIAKSALDLNRQGPAAKKAFFDTLKQSVLEATKTYVAADKALTDLEFHAGMEELTSARQAVHKKVEELEALIAQTNKREDLTLVNHGAQRMASTWRVLRQAGIYGAILGGGFADNSSVVFAVPIALTLFSMVVPHISLRLDDPEKYRQVLRAVLLGGDFLTEQAHIDCLKWNEIRKEHLDVPKIWNMWEAAGIPRLEGVESIVKSQKRDEQWKVAAALGISLTDYLRLQKLERREQGAPSVQQIKRLNAYRQNMGQLNANELRDWRELEAECKYPLDADSFAIWSELRDRSESSRMNPAMLASLKCYDLCEQLEQLFEGGGIEKVNRELSEKLNKSPRVQELLDEIANEVNDAFPDADKDKLLLPKVPPVSTSPQKKNISIQQRLSEGGIVNRRYDSDAAKAAAVRKIVETKLLALRDDLRQHNYSRNPKAYTGMAIEADEMVRTAEARHQWLRQLEQISLTPQQFNILDVLNIPGGATPRKKDVTKKAELERKAGVTAKEVAAQSRSARMANCTKPGHPTYKWLKPAEVTQRKALHTKWDGTKTGDRAVVDAKMQLALTASEREEYAKLRDLCDIGLDNAEQEELTGIRGCAPWNQDKTVGYLQGLMQRTETFIASARGRNLPTDAQRERNLYKQKVQTLQHVERLERRIDELDSDLRCLQVNWAGLSHSTAKILGQSLEGGVKNNLEISYKAALGSAKEMNKMLTELLHRQWQSCALIIGGSTSSYIIAAFLKILRAKGIRPNLVNAIVPLATMQLALAVIGGVAAPMYADHKARLRARIKKDPHLAANFGALSAVPLWGKEFALGIFGALTGYWNWARARKSRTSAQAALTELEPVLGQWQRMADDAVLEKIEKLERPGIALGTENGGEKVLLRKGDPGFPDEHNVNATLLLSLDDKDYYRVEGLIGVYVEIPRERAEKTQNTLGPGILRRRDLRASVRRFGEPLVLTPEMTDNIAAWKKQLAQDASKEAPQFAFDEDDDDDLDLDLDNDFERSGGGFDFPSKDRREVFGRGPSSAKPAILIEPPSRRSTGNFPPFGRKQTLGGDVTRMNAVQSAMEALRSLLGVNLLQTGIESFKVDRYWGESTGIALGREQKKMLFDNFSAQDIQALLTDTLDPLLFGKNDSIDLHAIQHTRGSAIDHDQIAPGANNAIAAFRGPDGLYRFVAMERVIPRIGPSTWNVLTGDPSKPQQSLDEFVVTHSDIEMVTLPKSALTQLDVAVHLMHNVNNYWADRQETAVQFQQQSSRPRRENIFDGKFVEDRGGSNYCPAQSGTECGFKVLEMLFAGRQLPQIDRQAYDAFMRREQNKGPTASYREPDSCLLAKFCEEQGKPLHLLHFFNKPQFTYDAEGQERKETQQEYQARVGVVLELLHNNPAIDQFVVHTARNPNEGSGAESDREIASSLSGTLGHFNRFVRKGNNWFVTDSLRGTSIRPVNLVEMMGALNVSSCQILIEPEHSQTLRDFLMPNTSDSARLAIASTAHANLAASRQAPFTERVLQSSSALLADTHLAQLMEQFGAKGWNLTLGDAVLENVAAEDIYSVEPRYGAQNANDIDSFLVRRPGTGEGSEPRFELVRAVDIPLSHREAVLQAVFDRQNLPSFTPNRTAQRALMNDRQRTPSSPPKFTSSPPASIRSDKSKGAPKMP